MRIDNYKIGKKNDGRRKLTDRQKEKIRSLYFDNNLPIRVIAKKYAHLCSRRLIQFILFPEREQKLKDQVKKERRWLKYYDTEKNKIAMRKTRAKKKKLMSQESETN